MALQIEKSNRRPGLNDTAKIREVFNAHDTDHDGTISRSELSMMLDKMAIKMSAEHKGQFFEMIDVDNSGEIEFGEFLDWYPTLMDMAEQEAQRLFAVLEKTTNFTRAELQTIYDNYKRVSASVTDDGMIDRQEFTEMLQSGGVSSWNSFLVDGMFRMFDSDSSGSISFEEFVTILSIYHNKNNKSKEEKHKLLFSLYDVDKDSVISKEDLSRVLSDCLKISNMQLEDKDVMRIVEATYARNGCNSKMDFNAYLKEMQARSLE